MITTPDGTCLWVLCTGVHPKFGQVPVESIDGDLVEAVAKARELTERYGGCAYVVTTVLKVHGKACDQVAPVAPRKKRAKRRR